MTKVSGKGRRRMLSGIGLGLALTVLGSDALAQTETKVDKPQTMTRLERAERPQTVQIFYLTNVSQQDEANQILTAVRNILDAYVKIFLVPTYNAIVISAPQDQLQIAQKLIADLDRPKRVYRLTYTITESDGTKRVGMQHFAMVVVSGQRTTMKQGSRVPVVTGSYDPGKTTAQNQVTYLDVGLNFDATLDESANGVRLKTKAEQSSVAPETSGVGSQDPVVRQTMLEGTSILTPGKPLVLGSLDVPGSTRHQDVEVVMEVVR